MGDETENKIIVCGIMLGIFAIIIIAMLILAHYKRKESAKILGSVFNRALSFIEFIKHDGSK